MSYSEEKRFYTHHMPVIVYLAIIFIQSEFPSSHLLTGMPVFSNFPFWDKILHYLGYTLLGMLFARVFLIPERTVFSAILLAGTSTAVCGFFDEIHQGLTLYRVGDPLDAMADALGGFTGAAGYVYFVKKVFHADAKT